MVGPSGPVSSVVDEGAIKFSPRHRESALEARCHGEIVSRLIAWREILARTGLVGQEPGLYGGFGYGNVSARVGAPAAPRWRRPFVISGTQTSGKACMTLDDFCRVDACDVHFNQVHSRGRVLPSSESLTHGAVYALGSHIRWVFHSHSPTIWRRARQLNIPTTHADVAYGTPQMAAEVERLFRETQLPEVRILAMGGHEDGIISFGRTAREAGETTIAHLARAYEAQCRDDGDLCRSVLPR